MWYKLRNYGNRGDPPSGKESSACTKSDFRRCSGDSPTETDFQGVLDGRGYTIDLTAVTAARNNRTLVPVRVIAETFGCDVQWDGAGQTVLITE